MARAKIAQRAPKDPPQDEDGNPIPKRVTVPGVKSRPYATSKSNAGLQETDELPASPGPAERGIKSPIKKPKLANIGIVTGFKNRNQPV